MSVDIQQLLTQALRLPPMERADLSEKLLMSLDQHDARLDDLWTKEAEARFHALETGDMKAYPLEEVFAELENL